MWRPCIVDRSQATEVALRPAEGDLILVSPGVGNSKAEVQLVIGPCLGDPRSATFPLGIGWAEEETSITLDATVLHSEVLEAPMEIDPSKIQIGVVPDFSRVVGRVSRSVTAELRARLDWLPYEPPTARAVRADEAFALVGSLGVYPEDFALFRMDPEERIRASSVVASLCASLGFDRLSAVQFGVVGAVGGIVLQYSRPDREGAFAELLWFAEPLDAMEARNADLDESQQALLVEDGTLTLAVYPLREDIAAVLGYQITTHDDVDGP